eukprot:2998894-Pyramimonas_sp.AAC.1
MSVHPVRQSTHFRDMPFQDAIANWWERISVVVGKVTKHVRRDNGKPQVRVLCEAARKLAGHFPDGVQKMVSARRDATSWP